MQKGPAGTEDQNPDQNRLIPPTNSDLYSDVTRNLESNIVWDHPVYLPRDLYRPFLSPSTPHTHHMIDTPTHKPYLHNVSNMPR